MKNKIIKSLAAGEIAMGIVHCIATFTPIIAGGLDMLTPGKQNAITYFSLMCGTLLILGGVLIILLKDKVNEYKFLKMPYYLILGVLLLNGVLAVAFMSANPCAWIILALPVLLVLFR